MSLCVLNLVVWMFGIGGHLPHYGDFGGGRSHSRLAGHSTLIRVLAVCIVAAVLLSLAIWGAVWLTINLL